MKYYELLKQAENRLAALGIEEAASDAWILFEAVFGMDRLGYLFQKTDEVPENERGRQQCHRFWDCIEQRSLRKPVQYITGKWDFMGMDFEVNEHVLIPRFDTECLVERAGKVIESIKNNIPEKSNISILDMCTGSGCIAISLKKLYDGSSEKCGSSAADLHITAVDLSEQALKVAERNAEIHHAEIEFIQSDLFEHIDRERKFDMIVSNPPYIKTEEIASLMPEVRSFEPMMALDGDFDGLKFYRKIISEGRTYIQTGGFLLFEIGCDQGNEVKKMLEPAGYEEIGIFKDLAGLDRVVAAQYRNENKDIIEKQQLCGTGEHNV